MGGGVGVLMTALPNNSSWWEDAQLYPQSACRAVNWIGVGVVSVWRKERLINANVQVNEVGVVIRKPETVVFE